MISTLEKEITLRFLKARKKDGFLNIISIFSFIGISLGVAVLIIVMSVMNGFRTELIDKIIGFNSHITVKPYENKIEINEINKDLERISKDLILSNSGEAVIVKTNNTKGILLRGYKSKEFSKLKIFKNKEFMGENENLENNNISLGNKFLKLFCNSPSKIGENKKNKTNIVIVNNGKKILNPFLPKTIGVDVSKPSQAFLEKVKNAASPVEIRKPKAVVFLNILLPFSRSKAMQNGQTKLSQEAA